ncbi:unnamed protein product [Echinostoma caproni]|uniref:Serine-rich adhesin for platelets-like n=1 Tax=Echinostoma caproni TaxID=27848 RepID=A0A183AHG0_9TREM|nr:unnamed protein product [Echinostoma caproni]
MFKMHMRSATGRVPSGRADHRGNKTYSVNPLETDIDQSEISEPHSSPPIGSSAPTKSTVITGVSENKLDCALASSTSTTTTTTTTTTTSTVLREPNVDNSSELVAQKGPSKSTTQPEVFQFVQLLATSLVTVTTNNNPSECSVSSQPALTVQSDSGSSMYTLVSGESSELVTCHETDMPLMNAEDSNEPLNDSESLGPVYVVDLSDLDPSNGLLEATTSLNQHDEDDCVPADVGLDIEQVRTPDSDSVPHYLNYSDSRHTSRTLNTTLPIQTTSPKSTAEVDRSNLWTNSGQNGDSNLCFIFNQTDSVVQLLNTDPNKVAHADDDEKSSLNVEEHLDPMDNDSPGDSGSNVGDTVARISSQNLFGSYPSSPILVDKSGARDGIWRPVESLDVETSCSRSDKDVPGGQFDQSDFVTFDCNILLNSGEPGVLGADGISHSPRFPSPVPETNSPRTMLYSSPPIPRNQSGYSFSATLRSDIDDTNVTGAISDSGMPKSPYEFGQVLLTDESNPCSVQNVSQFLPLIWCYGGSTNLTTSVSIPDTHHIYTTATSPGEFTTGTDQCSNFSVGYLIGQNRVPDTSNTHDLTDYQSTLPDCGQNTAIATTTSATNSVPSTAPILTTEITTSVCSPSTSTYLDFGVTMP